MRRGHGAPSDHGGLTLAGEDWRCYRRCKRRHHVWPARSHWFSPSTGSSRRSTEVKNFPYIFRASSREGNCRNCSVGVHIGPFESCPVYGLTSHGWPGWPGWQHDEARTARERPPHTIRGRPHVLYAPSPPHPFTHAPLITLQGRLEPRSPGSPLWHSYRLSAPTNSTSEIEPSLGNHAFTALLRERLRWKVMTERYYQYIVPLPCPHITHIMSVRQLGGPHRSTLPFQNAISKPLSLRSCMYVPTITMPDQLFPKRMATHSKWMPPSPS